MSVEMNATSVSSFRELTSEEFDMIAGGRFSLGGLAGAMGAGAIAGAAGAVIFAGGAGAGEGAIRGAVAGGMAYVVGGILEE